MTRMTGRMSMVVTVAGVGIALAAGATPAGAQDPMAGHEHHRMAMSNTAAPANLRAMEAQPNLEGLTLVDANGRSVALRDAVNADVPVMVNFIFTTCTTICPVMSAGFAQLEGRLAAEHRGVRLVSISIDPETDTPARLREYAARHGAGGDWMFLTGDPAASEAAQRAFGAFRGSKESHTAATFVRRTRSGPWERLDGLASGEVLMQAYAAGAAAMEHR